MSSATLWKSVAGIVGAVALVLGGASAATASDGPVPDCHSAEHAGLGLVMNCKSEHPGSG